MSIRPRNQSFCAPIPKAEKNTQKYQKGTPKSPKREPKGTAPFAENWSFLALTSKAGKKTMLPTTKLPKLGLKTLEVLVTQAKIGAGSSCPAGLKN